jgi:GTP-binding protein
MELKTIADVGLVGYPNVGKSTILSVVTSARPKIGNYHFTTLTPNLGIVRHYGKDFVLADIPGLVEGASEGVGLGHAFLRHVERTRLLLHVVDIAGSEGRDPIEDFDQINRELQNYGELADRPQIVVCNKTDLPDAEENIERMKEHVKELGYPVFAVSAATHQGFDPLLNATSQLLETLPPIQHFVEEVEIDEEIKAGSFEVVRDGAVYEVVGSSMDRLLNSVNFDDEESMNWFHRTLRRWGVIDALRNAGAEEGDTVRIIDMEFDFVE